jgi:hypothetical protein
MTTKKKILLGLITTTLIITSMGLFSFFKKSTAQTQTQSSIDPYKDSSTNFIYNLLFCDNLNLYKEKTQQPYTYPFDILFSEASSVTDLQKIIDDKIQTQELKFLHTTNNLQADTNQLRRNFLQ